MAPISINACYSAINSVTSPVSATFLNTTWRLYVALPLLQSWLCVVNVNYVSLNSKSFQLPTVQISQILFSNLPTFQCSRSFSILFISLFLHPSFVEVISLFTCNSNFPTINTYVNILHSKVNH